MRIISILGLASLIIVVYLIVRLVVKKNSKSINVTLLILLVIQIGFIMGLKAIALTTLLIFGLFFMCKKRKRKLSERTAILLIILLLIVIPFNEFFNGIHTFTNKDKFFELHAGVKKYYFWLPYKLYGEKYKIYTNIWEYPEDYYATIVSLEAPGQRWYNFIMPIRIDEDGDLYYQMSYGRWGNVCQRWFKYGHKITAGDWS